MGDNDLTCIMQSIQSKCNKAYSLAKHLQTMVPERDGIHDTLSDRLDACGVSMQLQARLEDLTTAGLHEITRWSLSTAWIKVTEKLSRCKGADTPLRTP